MEFVLSTETMIFGPRDRAALSDIHNYRRATVQYDRKADSKVALHISLFEPIDADNG